ncbi:TonB-dependent siderophore receptor [Neptunomonas sp. XY-337]|uniref:TonB-dependent receptor family protein n=1 Tax=Neptunomonas sp. XY-337 TaxID=2561897 RepID=UPI0010AAEAA8|nr:TonB-dependent siderophore receptor [Neptunomonas sp. XY-337]
MSTLSLPTATPSRLVKRKALYRFILLATLAPLAHASDAPETPDTLVITGNWLGSAAPEEVKTYPGSRDVISEEELHQRGALNLEDALRAAPGLQVLDETGTGILPNIGVRGLNPLRSERVQFLVDGYPLAIGPYTNVGVSLFPVTLDSIETVDIVRGGAAVHFGPNNLGGVINLHTRAIPYETRQTLSQKLTISEATGHIFSSTFYRAGGQVNEDLALQVQANLQTGAGTRDHSDTDVANFILDAQYQLDADNDIAAQLQYYDVDAELPGALSPQAYAADSSQSQRPHDAYDADMLRGTLTWTYTPSEDVEFQWRNFAHDADRTFLFGQRLGQGGHWADPAYAATHIADSPRLFTVFGTEPRLSWQTGEHQITVGARYISETVDFDVNREALASSTYANVRDWHFETDAYALYASDTISLLDERLHITPGLRYENVSTDYIDNKSGNKENNDVDEWLPGLTVGYQADDRLFVFANAQRSLVPVQTAQVTKSGEVANETAWNYEVGARFDTSDTLSTQVTLFRIDHTDLIQYDKPSNTYLNLGDALSQGIEITTDWQANEQLQLELGYSYLDTEQKSGAHRGNELPNAPRHRISAQANYDAGPWQANLTALHVSDSFSDAANTQQETANGSAGELASYTLLNARLARTLALANNKELQLSLAVNNLLDEEYYFRGVDVSPVGRVPAQGRAFIVEAKLDF